MLTQRRQVVLAALSSLLQPRDVVGQPRGALIPPIGLLLEQAHDDVGETLRKREIELGGGDRNRGEVVVDQLQRVAVTERRLAGRQLVQRRAKGIEVGALIHRSAGATRLLRRHVRQRAGDLALVRESWPLLGERARKVEVDQRRRLQPRRDDDVRGADISMHHAAAMHRGEDLRETARKLAETGHLPACGQRGRLRATWRRDR